MSNADLYLANHPFAQQSLSLKLAQSSHLEMSQNSGGGSDDSAVVDRSAPAGETRTNSKPKAETPSMYRVLLVNDDFTPMDFVTHVLQKFFQKTTDEATQIMLEVHHKGAGVCGVFTHEVAETKVHIVNTYAKQHRFPLKCTMEKAH